MPSRKPSKNDQIDTKLLPDAKIGVVPRGTQFSQIPMLQCVKPDLYKKYHSMRTVGTRNMTFG